MSKGMVFFSFCQSFIASIIASYGFRIYHPQNTISRRADKRLLTLSKRDRLFAEIGCLPISNGVPTQSERSAYPFSKKSLAQLQHLLNKISLKISLFLFCRFSLGTTDFPIPLNEVLSCSTFGRVWKYNVAACKFPLPDR